MIGCALSTGDARIHHRACASKPRRALGPGWGCDSSLAFVVAVVAGGAARSPAQPSGDRVRAGLAPVRRGRVPPRQGTGTRLAQLACASGTDRSGAALALERPRVVSGRYGLPPCCLALRTWRERWRRPCIVRTPTHVIAVRADGIVTRPSCPPSLNPVDGQLVCETNMWSSSACGH